MAVTFEQARQVVERALVASWPADGGALVVLEDGFEDDEAWHVVAGSREWLLEGDPAHALDGWPALLVDKRTGELVELVVVEHLERLGAMRPVRGQEAPGED